MILLGRVEARQRYDLRNDRIIPDLFARQLVDHRLRLVALFVGVIKHDRPILCAHIGALAILRRRIVDREEDAEQVAEADH